MLEGWMKAEAAGAGLIPAKSSALTVVLGSTGKLRLRWHLQSTPLFLMVFRFFKLVTVLKLFLLVITAVEASSGEAGGVGRLEQSFSHAAPSPTNLVSPL